MASIRQKPSGKWEARYRDARGRTHARSFGGKVAARRWAAEMESDLRRGEWIDPKLARITFGAWAEDAGELDAFLEQVRKDRDGQRPEPTP